MCPEPHQTRLETAMHVLNALSLRHSMRGDLSNHVLLEYTPYQHTGKADEVRFMNHLQEIILLTD